MTWHRTTLCLRLYAPNSGRTNLRGQIIERPNVTFCYPGQGLTGLRAAIWRSRGITNDLKRDGVQLYHGLSGELPINISKSGIKSIVTIHDLIFMRHPEFYNWIDVKIYTWKFRQTIREASHIVAISECTKRDIIELGGVDESRISLVYQSCFWSTRAVPQNSSAQPQQTGMDCPLAISSMWAPSNDARTSCWQSRLCLYYPKICRSSSLAVRHPMPMR